MLFVTRAPPETVQQYFKWFCAFPKATSPGFHNDGARSIETNKDNEYIFCNPSFAGPSRRDLGTIQYRKKKIFIPSCSFIGSEFESPGADVPRLYKFADVDHDNIEYRRIEIDGKPLEGDLDALYRVRTEPFEVVYPDSDALFGVHGGVSKAIADGVYIVYHPDLGDHEVHYEGKINLVGKKDALDSSEDHVEDVTYVFTVK